MDKYPSLPFYTSPVDAVLTTSLQALYSYKIQQNVAKTLAILEQLC